MASEAAVALVSNRNEMEFLAKPEGIARYLICNADESEPGTFKGSLPYGILFHIY